MVVIVSAEDSGNWTKIDDFLAAENEDVTVGGRAGNSLKRGMGEVYAVILPSGEGSNSTTIQN